MTTKQERVSDEEIEREKLNYVLHPENKQAQFYHSIFNELQAYRAVLPKVREALKLARKRSSYRWSKGFDYRPNDNVNEGKIELAEELLDILDSLELGE